MSTSTPRASGRDRDLDDPVEIAEMVRRFYADVAQDDLLGPMFEDVAKVDWSTHLPRRTRSGMIGRCGTWRGGSAAARWRW